MVVEVPMVSETQVDNLYMVDLKNRRRQIEHRCVYTLEIVTISADFTS